MNFKKNFPKVILLFICVLFSTACAYGQEAYVTTTPSSTNVAYGQSTAVTIHYRLAVPNTVGLPPLQFTSTQGNFVFNDQIIGTVPLPLTTTTNQGTEVLTIPRNVVETVFRGSGSSFRYYRNFRANLPPSPVGGGPTTISVDGYVVLNITPGSIAAFSIKRIELYFDGMQKRNEIMVDRNFKGLKAYADLYYNGSGFLNGYWEVDGLIIERVNRFVPTGGKVTLSTPNVPDLPTFDPGYHIVKFIVTNPATSFEVPEMVYWVKGTEEPVIRALALIKPADGMDIPTDFLFEWEKTEKASVYLISFARVEDKKVCFSALTRDASYRIPPSVLAEYLSPGGKYLWLVKGFDTENNIIAESGIQSFNLKDAAKP
jgi:hypothetical protein